MIYTGRKDNTEYVLQDEKFASGGEGSLYNIEEHPDIVAKIYANVDDEIEAKLTYMLNNPPDSSIINNVAWPVDLLEDESSKFVGFVMPKLQIQTSLADIYPYNHPSFGIQNGLCYTDKLIVARNVCTVISHIHDAGYVFGDFNPQNIGVTKEGHILFLDADSYHIYDKESEKTYRCKVCLDGYVAPEILRKIKETKINSYEDLPLPTFTQETDRFALSIHIFKLLMNGFSPYSGVDDTAQSTKGAGRGNKGIENNDYCFRPGKKPMSRAMPDIKTFSPKIQELFHLAFIEGYDNPSARPDANQWIEALDEFSANLISCPTDKFHAYYKENKECPLCKADKAYIENLNAKMIAQKNFGQIKGVQAQPATPTVSSAPLARPQPTTVKPAPPQKTTTTSSKTYSSPAKTTYTTTTYYSDKSAIITLILAILFGWCGAHNFYVGRKFKGILYLCTMGLFGIGVIVDIVNLFKGKFKDADKYIVAFGNRRQSRGKSSSRSLIGRFFDSFLWFIIKNLLILALVLILVDQFILPGTIEFIFGILEYFFGGLFNAIFG